MKLLLFSDLHADANAARRLVERARAVDLVIGAGDFGNVRRDVGEAAGLDAGEDRRRDHGAVCC